jgi:transglutaminase-like putative cysteine protease
MPALLALRLVTYLLVCTGVAALYLGNLIGAPGAALVVLAILVSWGHEQARERGAVRPALGWSLVGAAAVAIAVDLFYLAYSLLDGMVHLLLFLILLRLFARRGLRDLRDAGLLSFFMLVAAASISFNLSFLFVFIAFFLLGTWMLMLNHVVTELELAGRPGDVATTARRVFFRGPLTRVSLVAAIITFWLAAGLFFVIPRVGQAALPLRASIGRMVTGFSDRVDLGSFGDIESDRSVVMRVYLADEWLDPATLPGLRWRGVAFDQFDGQTWSSAAAPRRFMHRSITGDFGLGLPRGTGPVVRQEIYLEPIGSDAVFAAPRAVRLEMRSPTLAVDDMDGLTVSSPGARLHYVVESEIESPARPLGPGRRPSPMLTGADRERYLQLPPLPPGIARLARELTAGSADAEASASRISTHLSTNYRYTLALKRQTALAPLEEFLFVRRSGNCEYFAAALAVMLRSIGVPARVAVGFQQGDWNPYGRYFMVRLSDAHAWVEVYLDGRGWVAFDPSPRAEAMAEEIPGGMSLYLDAARMRWYRYVVSWSLRDQVQLAASVHRQAADARVALAWPRDWRVSPAVGIGAGLAVVVALLWWLQRHGPVLPRTGPAARMPAFYERALRLLARRGLAPGAAETARQFASRVGERAPDRAAAFGRLTSYYERSRFGHAPLSEAERQDVLRSLASLSTRS